MYGYQQTQSVFNSSNNLHTPNSRMRLIIHRSFDEYAEQYTWQRMLLLEYKHPVNEHEMKQYDGVAQETRLA